MKSVIVAIGIAAVGIALPKVCAADDAQLPVMDRDRPVLCLRDSADEVWRIQCDPSTRVCLYAPNEELDSEGHRVKPLERARTCELDAPFDRKQMEADGYQFLPGRVDAPYGWMRDERQRVFQVNFDLKRRLYFGVAYTPEKILDNPLSSTRTSIDFGFLFDVASGDKKAPTLHRIKLFQGEVHLAPFSSEFTMVHYDVSHHFFDPLLRITTFTGTPERHDLAFNLGTWDEAGGLEIHPTPYGYSQLWRHATAEITLDLWQSANLESFVRLRTGLGLEGQHDDVNGYRSGIAYTSAFEASTVLDKNGFHNLDFEFIEELPRYFTATSSTPLQTQRTIAHVQYETILLAINDQPLTFKLAAGGEKRDDLPGIPNTWAFVAEAGLRFSLWAPPRRQY